MFHYLAMKDMFKKFSAYRCEGYGHVVGSVAAVTFLKNG